MSATSDMGPAFPLEGSRRKTCSSRASELSACSHQEPSGLNSSSCYALCSSATGPDIQYHDGTIHAWRESSNLPLMPAASIHGSPINWRVAADLATAAYFSSRVASPCSASMAQAGSAWFTPDAMGSYSMPPAPSSCYLASPTTSRSSHTKRQEPATPPPTLSTPPGNPPVTREVQSLDHAAQSDCISSILRLLTEQHLIIRAYQQHTSALQSQNAVLAQQSQPAAHGNASEHPVPSTARAGGENTPEEGRLPLPAGSGSLAVSRDGSHAGSVSARSCLSSADCRTKAAAADCLECSARGMQPPSMAGSDVEGARVLERRHAERQHATLDGVGLGASGPSSSDVLLRQRSARVHEQVLELAHDPRLGGHSEGRRLLGVIAGSVASTDDQRHGHEQGSVSCEEVTGACQGSGSGGGSGVSSSGTRGVGRQGREYSLLEEQHTMLQQVHVELLERHALLQQQHDSARELCMELMQQLEQAKRQQSEEQWYREEQQRLRLCSDAALASMTRRYDVLRSQHHALAHEYVQHVASSVARSAADAKAAQRLRTELCAAGRLLLQTSSAAPEGSVEAASGGGAAATKQALHRAQATLGLHTQTAAAEERIIGEAADQVDQLRQLVDTLLAESTAGQQQLAACQKALEAAQVQAAEAVRQHSQEQAAAAAAAVQEVQLQHEGAQGDGSVDQADHYRLTELERRLADATAAAAQAQMEKKQLHARLRLSVMVGQVGKPREPK